MRFMRNYFRFEKVLSLNYELNHNDKPLELNPITAKLFNLSNYC